MQGMIHPNPELWNCHSGFSQGLTGPGFWSQAGYISLPSPWQDTYSTTMAPPLTDQPQHEQNIIDASMRRRISALQEEVANLHCASKQTQ